MPRLRSDAQETIVDSVRGLVGNIFLVIGGSRAPLKRRPLKTGRISSQCDQIENGLITLG